MPNIVDILIIVGREDFCLLQACLNSIELFSKLSGKIHIFLWKRENYLLCQINLPSNVVVHYKDDIDEMVDDDFRNQMYIKLTAHRYISAKWVWIVDADYLLCDEIYAQDLFDTEGKPYWFYRSWDSGPPTQRWRVGSEIAVASTIPYLFLDEPQFVLSTDILRSMEALPYADHMLRMKPMPADCIVYGAYAYDHFQEEYHWINFDDPNQIKSISYKVNQRPPSYCDLDEEIRLEDLPIAKYYVFWSHWDCAEQKMAEFLTDAQIRKWGQTKKTLSDKVLYIQASTDDVASLGMNAWGGCYSDGWVKRRSHVRIQAAQWCTLEIEFECLEGQHSRPLLLMRCGETNLSKELNPGVNRVAISIPANVEGFPIDFFFENGVKEGDQNTRTLYARVKSHHFQLHPVGFKDLLPGFHAIPEGSVLGLNYSGMHDSAIAVVGLEGEPILACALERLSRVKQDGRPPFAMLESMPWDRIAKVAISTDQHFIHPLNCESQLLTKRLPLVRDQGLKHSQPFYDFLNLIPAEKVFVCHQMAHAASAFWASGFESALCLTYDGGMNNSPWFGGLYLCDRQTGIEPLDQFSALHYAKITSLYTFITALLGFTPNKHEGKITGLAAFGKPTDACRSLLTDWFESEFLSIESTMEWIDVYEADQIPAFNVRQAKMQPYRAAAQRFTREELAATVQEMTEQHVLDILARAKTLGWTHQNICLAGGLFANVKINQRVVDSGFHRLFVAPPMTDDGTALGAAWHVLSSKPGFAPARLKSMYLGPTYRPSETEELLISEKIQFERLDDPAERIANLLADDQVVAVFQGAMEFGPRSLGNRSILAQATRSDINENLNRRLNRTEFMPFAPITRVEDAASCYLGIDQVAHSAEFMTVTVNCTEKLISACPAVVHVDGTARPQLVSRESNPVIHEILTKYGEKTECPALVNTSFNIHEEPIVCSPQDAIQGFFESGLDYLYLEGGYLISFKDNAQTAVKYLQDKVKRPSIKHAQLVATIASQDARLAECETQLFGKERVINDQHSQIVSLHEQLAQHSRALRAYRMAFGGLSPLGPIARLIRRCYSVIRPRLGQLSQYVARHLSHYENTHQSVLIAYPRISIVTPSYQQGSYIERTIQSVLDQRYPKLQYFVQDGGSSDSTVAVLKKYEDKLAGWTSVKDFGQSQAINRGFANTDGEIMAWLNSDDLLLPGALHAVADYFNNHPDVDVVYANRLLIDENDMEIGRWILPGHDSDVLSWVDYVPQETLFWRRRIWEKVGGRIDESFRFAMDWDLLVRFRDAGAKFGHIPQFFGAFRIHEQQKTSAAMNEIGHHEMNRIRERILGRVPDRKEIRRAVLPYLAKHIAVDMVFRVKKRLGWKV